MKNPDHPEGLAQLSSAELASNMRWLRAFATSLVNDPHEADDLVQSALSAAIASKDRIGNLRAFLAGSVRKLAWNRQRQARHRRDREYARAAESPEQLPPAEHHLESMDTMRVTLEEVAKLPATQARTISLRFVEDLDFAEIANRMGTTESTVRSNLARGLNELRRRLDQRFGDRGSWALGLIPLAYPGATVPVAASAEFAADGSPSHLPASGATASNTPVAVGSSLALLSTAMTTKLVLAAAAPVLLLFGYAQLDSRTSSERGTAPASLVAVRSDAPELPPRTEPDLLIGDSVSGPTRRELPTAVPEEVTESLAADVAAVSSTPSSRDITLTLVNLSDSSPVFNMEVVVTATGEGKSLDPRIARSDSRGRLVIKDLPEDITGLSLSSREESALGRPLFVPGDVDLRLPIPETTLVMVGPTYFMNFAGAEVPANTEMLASLEGPGISTFIPYETELVWDEQPWIRFPQSPSGGAAEQKGPWTLRVESRDGLLSGEGTVPSIVGTIEAPIQVHIKGSGAVRFTAGSDFMDPASSAPLPFVELNPARGEAALCVQLARAEEGIESTIGALSPGRYAWNLGGLVSEDGSALEGVLDVIIGKAVTVELPKLGGPNLDRSLIIDASEVPDADLTTWGSAAVKVASKGVLAFIVPERAEDLGPGMWRAHVGPTPRDGWLYSLNAAEGFEVSPKATGFKAGKTPPVIRVTRKVETLTVRLRFQDASTGEPLTRRDRAAAVYVNQLTPIDLSRGTKGTLLAKDVPSDRSGYFLCTAKGYCMEEVPFEPGNSGKELTVKLTPGWSSLVSVFHMEKLGPQAGVAVVVDGVEAGVTDANGRLWLEGDGPPELIELDLEGDPLSLALSPFESGTLRNPDPAGGYRFLVKAR